MIITGVAGMVGSNLLNKYIKDQDKIIIGIDNFELGKKKFISKYYKKKNFFFFNINLSKKIKSKNFLNLIKNNYVSEVWLLAANSDISKGINDSYVDLKNTLLTTINTLEYIKPFLKKNTKIIFTSTSAIYGQTNVVISENNLNLNPISNYGSMKLACESYLSSYSYLNKVKSIIFRFPNVVGKNLTHGILFDMKKKIKNSKKYIQVLGNGTQQKPYSHVSEIINCMLFAKNKSQNQNFSVFNIGSNDNGMTVRDIVELMVQKYKSRKKIKYQKKEVGWKGDVSRYKYSTKKINKLGYKFKINSLNSISRAIEENF